MIDLYHLRTGVQSRIHDDPGDLMDETSGHRPARSLPSGVSVAVHNEHTTRHPSRSLSSFRLAVAATFVLFHATATCGFSSVSTLASDVSVKSEYDPVNSIMDPAPVISNQSSLKPPATERETLEEEKLRLEIQRLRGWQTTWGPILPAALTAISVLIGFVIAMRAGVFEARTTFLRAETVRLEVQKAKLAEEIALAPVQALSERVKTVPDVRLGAVEELIARLQRLGTQRSRDVRFLSDTVGDVSTSGAARGVLLYCLYHGTQDSEWLSQFITWASDELPKLSADEQRQLYPAFGESRWTSARREISRVLVQLASRGDDDLARVAMMQLARLTKGCWKIGGERGFSLYEADPDTFFNAAIRARDLSLAGADVVVSPDQTALIQALPDIAPPLALVVVGSLLGTEAEQGERNAFRYGGSLLNAVTQANNYVVGIYGPYAAQGEFRYDDGQTGRWRQWCSQHRQLLSDWMDPKLTRLRGDQNLFKSSLRLYVRD